MRAVFLTLLIWFGVPGAACAETPIAAQVRSIVFAPEGSLGTAHAKLELDHLVDPSINVPDVVSDIDRMAETVRQMLATIPEAEAKKSIERLKALKAFIYRAGHWNDDKPFEYNLGDPYGKVFETRLLTHYLKTRRGNCVSMPLLFLALGERLDLELTLSTAPLHFLVKYTDDQTQQTYNLEATSGAGFTRDSWYQKKAPMTDKAIANGVYLKPLSPLEVRAVLAGIVVEHLIETERYEDAIAVSDVILEAYPEHAYVWIKKATAYYHLLRTEFRERYPNERDIPEEKLARATFLYQQNQLSFEHAEQLGWQAPELE